MSFARVAFASTLPFALSPDEGGAGSTLAGGGGTAAAAPAPAAPATPAAPAAPAAAPAPTPGAAPAAAAPAAPAAVAAPAASPVAPGATPVAAPTDPGSATLAGGKTDAAPPVAVPADFPADWRERMAGDDTKLLEQLKRLNSPVEVAKSWRNIVLQRDSGELRPPPKAAPGADAKPEEIAAWRKEQGIPETADGYVTGLKLPDGVVVGEADKPLLNEFAKAFHADGMSTETYNKVVGQYYKIQDGLIARQQQADVTFRDTAREELQREWGQEFKGNGTQVANFLRANLSESSFARVLSARTPDGQVLGNDAQFNREMLSLAKLANPAGTALPNVAGATMQDVETQIKAHEKNMNSKPGTPEWKQYWASPEAMGKYNKLLETRITDNARKASAR